MAPLKELILIIFKIRYHSRVARCLTQNNRHKAEEIRKIVSHINIILGIHNRKQGKHQDREVTPKRSLHIPRLIICNQRHIRTHSDLAALETNLRTMEAIFVNKVFTIKTTQY